MRRLKSAKSGRPAAGSEEWLILENLVGNGRSGRMILFSPTPDSLIDLFKRRGTDIQFVEFWHSSNSGKHPNFDHVLDPDEKPVLRISVADSGVLCWLTTKRLMWCDLNGQHEILLIQVSDAEPRDFDSIPVAVADVLRITTSDGNQYDIQLPSSGVMQGIWGILGRYARRR